MSLPPNTPLAPRLCSNCLYFDAHTEGGLCRRYPPQSARGLGVGINFGWPPVRSTDFCGQHVLQPSRKEGD